MKKVFKIYQTNFCLMDKADQPVHDHDYFLKLDDQDYATLNDAEEALGDFLALNEEAAEEEYAILPIYRRN